MSHPCDICILEDGDYTPKDATYCAPCKVWKCSKCLYDPIRTIKAFAKKHLLKPDK